MDMRSEGGGRDFDTATAGGWRATLALRFVGDGAVTRLADNRHEGPLRLLKPLASGDGRRLDAVIVHPPGGLVAGDLLAIDVEAAAGSAVLLTTPGAQKWYRGANGWAAQVVSRLALGDAAALDWLPQPAILFDGACATQSLAIAMPSSASCAGWEMLIRGRAAMGETWSQGRIDQRIEIVVDGRARWRQCLVADADDRLFDSRLGWMGRRAAASVWFCAPSRPVAALTAVRDRWREAMAACDAIRGGATLPGDGLVLAQLLGDDVESLQQCAVALWRAARSTAAGAPAEPRIWRT